MYASDQEQSAQEVALLQALSQEALFQEALFQEVLLWRKRSVLGQQQKPLPPAPPLAAPSAGAHHYAGATPTDAGHSSAGRLLAGICLLAAAFGFVVHVIGLIYCVLGLVDPATYAAIPVPKDPDSATIELARYVLSLEAVGHELLVALALVFGVLACLIVFGRRPRMAEGCVSYVGAGLAIVSAFVLDVLRIAPQADAN